MGTIPAWAGEPYLIHPVDKRYEDYPRVGGGTPWRGGRSWQASGLSPRGRGNRRNALSARLHNGTIPAWAGEPTTCSGGMGISKDYPRVGGGTPWPRAPRRRRTGLSPRGRGNRRATVLPPCDVRTIPAWAGEPASVSVHQPMATDYPRVGGGTIVLLGGSASILRTIPAWAGEPETCVVCGYAGLDYPRVGGGTGFYVCGYCYPRGLSPRGRGNPHLATR